MASESNSKWAIELGGSEFDINELEKFLGGEDYRIIRISGENHASALVADELDCLTNEEDVFLSAERLLDLMNGIQFVTDQARELITVKAIRHRTADGSWSGRSIRVRLEGGKLRIRGASVGFTITKNGVAQPTPLAKQAKWISTAAADDRAGSVINYLKGSPSYFELYQAFELMRDDINQTLGQQKQEKMGWPSKSKLDHFTMSANVHRHSSIKWPAGYNLQNAMPLAEARGFVSELVAQWLDWRVSSAVS